MDKKQYKILVYDRILSTIALIAAIYFINELIEKI